MNLELNYEGYEKYLIDSLMVPDEQLAQYVFMFDNGYGASVIKTIYPKSYGAERDLWELAVIRDLRHSHIINDQLWYIVYDTPITDDVLGCLTDDEVKDVLGKIKKLPEKDDR